MPTNNETPKNGQTSPAQSGTVPPSKEGMVNISRMPTGDLLEAFWHGMNGRQTIMDQLRMAQEVAGKDANLSKDIQFRAAFKETQERLGGARDGCNTIKREINVRFTSIDAMRMAMLEEEVQQE